MMSKSDAKQVAAARICLRCGTRSSAGVEVCQRCGEKLREAKVSGKKEKKSLRLCLDEVAKVPEPSSQDGAGFGINRIYCGDCREIMRRMPEESVDLIVTSPPYNFGLDEYDRHSDTRSWPEYFATLAQVWRQSYRVMRRGGRLCVVVQPLFSDYMPTHHIISQQLRELGFLFKAEIMWEKHNYNCKYTAWGSWKKPSMPYLKYTWEFIEVFCKDDYKKDGRVADVDITAEEFKKWVYGKWDIAPESKMKQFGHPAMFPEEIPYRLIKLFSYVGDTVFDPFNGAGTTTLVAWKLRRNYIGVDISWKYCRQATERIRDS